ncbi:MAG: inorganic phosphate transporter, partial [Planctomycetota bacterium]|nr:inorganic phosphate transporter [Planctomycetota bacterium]
MQTLAALLLGWTLGANDAANCFGTAVSSHMVRWRTAALLVACFALLGALGEGGRGLGNLAALMGPSSEGALTATLAAALAVAIFTAWGLPVSVSHAVGGALVGVKIAGAGVGVSWAAWLPWREMRAILLCWLTTPVGALCLALILYPILAFLVREAKLHFLTYDAIMR